MPEPMDEAMLSPFDVGADSATDHDESRTSPMEEDEELEEGEEIDEVYSYAMYICIFVYICIYICMYR